MPKRAIPENQGALFEVTPMPEAVEVEGGFVYPLADFDPPATSLADYYRTLHTAVTALGGARSKSEGFSKLAETSRPVKEYAERMEADNDDAQHTVVKSSSKNRFKAQDILNKRSQIEYDQLVRFARATGAFTLEEIQKNLPLPPSIEEVELKYFKDPSKSPAELRALRRQLARRAQKYSQKPVHRVA